MADAGLSFGANRGKYFRRCNLPRRSHKRQVDLFPEKAEKLEASNRTPPPPQFNCSTDSPHSLAPALSG